MPKIVSDKSQTPNLFSVTEIELIYRNKVKAKDRLKIKTSEDAYNILRQSWDENKIELVEETKILLLDQSHSVLGISHLFRGGISDCTSDTRIVYAAALKAKASGVIMAHNHPSGNPTPSEADLKMTKILHTAGKILRINFLDMFILVRDGYRSFADEGLIPV